MLVRVAPDSRIARAMPPVRKAVSVWIARKRATVKKERRKRAIRWRANAFVTQIIVACGARLSARPVDTAPSAIPFAIAKTTDRVTTWEIAIVLVDGLENFAKTLAPKVLFLFYVILSLLILVFYIIIIICKGFYGKNCRQPCPRCVNGIFISPKNTILHLKKRLTWFLFLYKRKRPLRRYRRSMFMSAGLYGNSMWRTVPQRYVCLLYTIVCRLEIDMICLLAGTFGEGCRQKCTRCKNGAECHHVTGLNFF